MILCSAGRVRQALERGLILLCLTRALGAQAAPAPADPIPPRDTLTITSRAIGEARRINVHVPSGYATSTARFPVLYMPDGGLDEDFPHVVNTVDSLIALGVIRPVIVVGIPNTERRRDLTGPTRVHSDSAIAPRVGGSDAFRRFIRDELMPVVQQRYRTTGERAIVGESLAGLFIVETFFLAPEMFDTYIALDPSLWWNRQALVNSAPELLKERNGQSTLFLATSDEKGIVKPTEQLVEALKANAPAGVHWSYEPMPAEGHGTIYHPAALKAFRALFKPAPKSP